MVKKMVEDMTHAVEKEQLEIAAYLLVTSSVVPRTQGRRVVGTSVVGVVG